MDSSSSSVSLSSSSLLHLALTEAAGGAAAGAIADAVLYSLDSAKVRAQSPPSVAVAAGGGRGSESIRILFRGLGPTICLGSVPVFGSFFLLYAPLKQIVLHKKQSGCCSDDDNKNNRTILQQEENALWMLPFVSALCAIPATIIGVPADVLKKRLVLGLDKDVVSAIQHAVARNGTGHGLFAGWYVNLIRDIPFAGVKIGLYEIFIQYFQRFYNQQQRQDDKINTKTTNNNKISSTGASICGIASDVSCAILTCPLDVVNTRIKAADSTTSHSTSIRTVALEILQKEGVAALFRGVVMRSVVLGIGSSIFWPIQHRVAHSLQSYEVDNRTTTPSFMS